MLRLLQPSPCKAARAARIAGRDLRAGGGEVIIDFLAVRQRSVHVHVPVGPQDHLHLAIRTATGGIPPRPDVGAAARAPR